MELIMKTDFAAFPKAIEYNHEELKGQITSELEKYQNMVVTENDIARAKGDRAKLNKFKEAVNAKRIEIKNAYMQPYKVFEENIKEIVAIVDEPIKAIDVQIKFFEDEKKQAKKNEIEALYLDEIGELIDLIPIAKIWNSKWLNVTYKLTDIAIEIETAVSRVKSGLQIIGELHCGFEKQVMDKFIQTLDINAALSENKRLEEQEKKLSTMKQLAAQKPEPPLEKLIQTAAQQEPEVERAGTDEIAKADTREFGASMEQSLICIDFRVFATAEQAVLLKDFLIEHNIQYGKVPQAV